MQKIGALTVLLIPRHNQSEINHLCALTKPVAWILPGQYGKISYQPIIDDVLKENGQLKHIIQVRTREKWQIPHPGRNDREDRTDNGESPDVRGTKA